MMAQVEVLMKFVTKAVNLVFPPQCIGCPTFVQGHQTWCDICRHLAVRVDVSECCEICSMPLRRAHETLCIYCKSKRPAFEKAVGFYRYEGLVRETLRRVKAQKRITDGYRVARPLRDEVQQMAEDWDVKGVALVPPHASALRSRGFYLPAQLAGWWRFRRPLILAESRKAQKQAMLGRHERSLNMEGTMECLTEVSGNWLVVDDVITTGATANEAARALREAGANAVFVLAMARVP